MRIARWVSKAPYTLSVKLSDFIAWRHTWRKNWVKCAVLTGNSAGLRTVFPVVFHTENCTVLWGNPTVSSVYLPTPRWHHLKQFIQQMSITWYIPFKITLLTPYFTLSFLLFG
jgi:hypothetical protein